MTPSLSFVKMRLPINNNSNNMIQRLGPSRISCVNRAKPGNGRSVSFQICDVRPIPFLALGSRYASGCSSAPFRYLYP